MTFTYFEGNYPFGPKVLDWPNTRSGVSSGIHTKTTSRRSMHNDRCSCFGLLCRKYELLRKWNLEKKIPG